MTSAQYHILHHQFALEANGRLCEHMDNQNRKLGFNPIKIPVSVYKVNDAEGVIGGAGGMIFPGWLFLDLLFVEPRYRKQGIGAELLRQIENEAVRLGAHSAYLWTQDYESPDFYHKYGYKEFVQLQEFMPGHQLIGMQKKLAEI